MKKSEKNKQKISLFAIFLTGLILLCTSAIGALMTTGGQLRTGDFFFTGEVCEVPLVFLRESSDTMSYSKQQQRYEFHGDVAKKKFVINGKQQSWRYACVTIGDMSSANIEGYLIFYDRDRNVLQEQPMTWVAGENHIKVDESLSVYAVSLQFLHADGGYADITAIQFRSGETLFTLKEFVKRFVGFLALFSCLFFLQNIWMKTKGMAMPQKSWSGFGEIAEMTADFLGKKLHAVQTMETQRQVMAYTVLFLLMIVGGSRGWNLNSACYRYYLLACTVLVILVCGNSWNPSTGLYGWNHRYFRLWNAYWIVAVLSNLLVTSRIHLSGFVMLTAGNLFLFVWRHMKNPYRMYLYMVKALRLTFLPAVIYALWIGFAHENDIQASQVEMFVMYCTLLNVIFLNQIWRAFQNKALKNRGLTAVAGFILSAYFVLFIHNGTAIFAMLVGWILFGLYNRHSIFGTVGKHRKKLVILIGIICAGVVLAGVVRIACPDFRQMVVVWKHYIWELNLFGHGEELNLFMSPAAPCNAFMQIIYRYGLIVLAPYLGILIYVFCFAVGVIKRGAMNRKGTNARLIGAITAIMYLCFVLTGNPEQDWGQPLWFLFWIGNGVLFLEEDSSGRDV